MKYQNEIRIIKEAIRNDTIFWKNHILQRMRDRDISVYDVLSALQNPDIIEEYRDDRPFPSFLILGYTKERPLHIVVAINTSDNEIHLITVYIPDSSIWDDSFRRKI